MMQLVTPTVKILNPQKDNLILDPPRSSKYWEFRRKRSST